MARRADAWPMLASMAHTLYVIHGSHPCATATRALELKGQPFRAVEYPPMLHVPAMWLRFRHARVPAMVLGSGEQVAGSRAIVHRLDELVPDPPLLPADPAARARVEEAERWGDEVLQWTPRRLFWAGIVRRPDAIVSYGAGSRLPFPPFAQRWLAPAIARLAVRWDQAREVDARREWDALPAHLDRVDGWISEGVMGGEQPNAADLQIGASIRFLGTFADVRPLLEGRPCWALARRLWPEYPGEMPAGTLAFAT
jgi:glutathione S-transferase